MKIYGGGTAEEIKASTELYNSYILNGNATHVKLEFRDSNNSALYFYDDDIDANSGITLNSIMNPDVDLTFGRAISTEITVNLLKSLVIDSIDFSKDMWIYFGLDINGTTDWKLWGGFSIEKKEQTYSNTDIVTIIGRDRISKYNVSAYEFISTLTFPTTVNSIISSLATYLGVTITKVITSATFNYNINANPFSETCTIRDIFAWIAELCGGYVRYNNSVITIYTFRIPDYNIDYTLTADHYYELNKSNITITGVPAVRYVDLEDIANAISYPATYTGIPYDIVDNPIAKAFTTAEKTNLVTLLYNQILTLGGQYRPNLTPMNVTAIGNWMVEAGDIINVVDADGNTVPMWIFSRTLQWNGGCVDYYECTGNLERQPSEQEQRGEYKIAGQLDGKADKVSSATNGNFAGLDNSGNLTDSGKKASDFKTTQTAKSDPTASGTAVQFIDTLSQNANGVITATKKTVRTFVKSGSNAASGLVPAPSTTAGTTKFLREDATWQVALTQHQDISGKKNTQTAKSDPSANGVSTSFIATLSQNAQGVITATKKKIVESFSIPASGSKTFNVGNSYRGVFFIIGGTAAAQDVITVYSTSAGAIAYQKMGSSSSLTVTTGTGTIKIANSLSYAQSCYVMTFSGSVS